MPLIQGRDEYLSPADASRFFAKAAEVDLPESLRCDAKLFFLQSKPLSGTFRFDMSEAKSVLGFEPSDVWPAGIETIRNDGEYTEKHNDRLEQLYSRPPNGDGVGESKSSAAPPLLAPAPLAPLALCHERSAEELALRVELAAAYRVFAMLGWEHVIHTHITGTYSCCFGALFWE